MTLPVHPLANAPALNSASRSKAKAHEAEGVLKKRHAEELANTAEGRQE
jgi:hypothetical protein